MNEAQDASFLDDWHWKKEHHSQRITVAQWRKMLLQHQDKITFEGTVRRLAVRNLGYGVVEIYKAALPDGGKDGK